MFLRRTSLFIWCLVLGLFLLTISLVYRFVYVCDLMERYLFAIFFTSCVRWSSSNPGSTSNLWSVIAYRLQSHNELTCNVIFWMRKQSVDILISLAWITFILNDFSHCKTTWCTPWGWLDETTPVFPIYKTIWWWAVLMITYYWWKN